jgi:hypothetical protein
MDIPKYADDRIFQKIVELCSMIGLRVDYIDLPDHIEGRTDRNTCIYMSKDNIYEDSVHAGRTLAHELAHTILEYMPVSHIDENGIIADEVNCDMIGNAFYQFAELIVTREIEAEFNRELALQKLKKTGRKNVNKCFKSDINPAALLRPSESNIINPAMQFITLPADKAQENNKPSQQ